MSGYAFFPSILGLEGQGRRDVGVALSTFDIRFWKEQLSNFSVHEPEEQWV